MSGKPLMRWWTSGQFEPRQVELVEYLGDDVWSSQDLGDGDVADVTERELYMTEEDAQRAYLEWLENVFYFVRDTAFDRNSKALPLLSERIAIANSKLDKGR